MGQENGQQVCLDCGGLLVSAPSNSLLGDLGGLLATPTSSDDEDDFDEVTI
jgi:hypothetical protein